VSIDTQALPSSSSPNKLLARLPGNEYRTLLPHLKTIHLRPKRVLLKPGAPTEKIYFLAGGVCSITYATADGQTAGVAMIGNEGLIGIAAFGGDPESGMTAVLEIAEGDAQVMDAKVFRREMQRRTAFNDLIHRYAQAFIESLMQSVACNALHSVEKRCARCLLEIRDRVGRNELPITQIMLADMLGVRRASVTLAAGALQRAHMIEHVHKRIVISDPTGLEATACECYALIKRHFARLLS
jgi:CRP-like cAMP-binding protein